MPNPRPDAAAVPGMSAFARLDLSDERFEIVAPVIDMLYGAIDTLDELDTSAVFPSSPYDPRWR